MSHANPNLSSWKALIMRIMKHIHPRFNNKVLSNITVLLIDLGTQVQRKKKTLQSACCYFHIRVGWCGNAENHKQVIQTNHIYRLFYTCCLPRAGTLAAPCYVCHHHHLVSVTSLYVSIQAVHLLPVLTHHSTDNISNWYHANHFLIINHRNVPDAFICQPL